MYRLGLHCGPFSYIKAVAFSLNTGPSSNMCCQQKLSEDKVVEDKLFATLWLLSLGCLQTMLEFLITDMLSKVSTRAIVHLIK